MVLNDLRLDGNRFQLEETWDVRLNETRTHMVEWVAKKAKDKGKLKNLVLHCHGEPAYLKLGEGFSLQNLGSFSPWRGLVEKIWLSACQVARIPNLPSYRDNGNSFCAYMAKIVGCYVVAPTETQCNEIKTYPIDCIPSYEGLVLCYGPNGNISWSGRNASTFALPGGSCSNVPD
jgi:hypothetical protein